MEEDALSSGGGDRPFSVGVGVVGGSLPVVECDRKFMSSILLESAPRKPARSSSLRKL